MSTRWYPLYQKGNPQIRIFLPNFLMKLVQPEEVQPKNIVTFHVSIQMTKHDIKNYLEKIYNVKVMKVNTRIRLGRIKRHEQVRTIMKEDDVKIAYVHLPKDQQFEFPNLFASNIKEKEDAIRENNMKLMKEDNQKFLDKNKNSQGVPGWFSI